MRSISAYENVMNAFSMFINTRVVVAFCNNRKNKMKMMSTRLAERRALLERQLAAPVLRCAQIEDINSLFEEFPPGAKLLLGTGSYGTVRRMRRKSDTNARKLFAVKTVNKNFVAPLSASCQTFALQVGMEKEALVLRAQGEHAGQIFCFLREGVDNGDSKEK